MRQAWLPFVSLTIVRAAAPRLGGPPAEEREVCARAAFRIRIEEMISTNVVLVHRPLDQPHAEGLGVEAVVLSNRRRDRSEVMNAGKFHAVTKAIDSRLLARSSTHSFSPGPVHRARSGATYDGSACLSSASKSSGSVPITISPLAVRGHCSFGRSQYSSSPF